MQIIIEQIAILSLIGIIGIIAFKTKALSKENCSGLVKVIMKITLPLLIFTTFANTNLTKEIITNFPIVFASSVFTVALLFFLSSLSAKILKLNRENKALHNVHSMFGNVVFLGFPLLNALFPGGEGLIYATIFQLGHDTLMWTWGIFILNTSAKKQAGHNWKHLINPTTISFITGLLFMLLKIKVPEIINKPLTGLGHTTIYLSMIYVGAILAQVKLKPLISNLRSYLLSFNKLIIAPIILLILLVSLKKLGLNISDKALISSVMQASMPCMIIISVLAEELGLNSKQAVENILVSSILSIISLPLVYYLSTMLV